MGFPVFGFVATASLSHYAALEFLQILWTKVFKISKEITYHLVS